VKIIKLGNKPSGGSELRMNVAALHQAFGKTDDALAVYLHEGTSGGN
jgi:hypothetical protein